MKDSVEVRVSQIKQELINLAIKEQPVNVLLISQINNAGTHEILSLLLKNINMQEVVVDILRHFVTRFDEDDLPY